MIVRRVGHSLVLALALLTGSAAAHGDHDTEDAARVVRALKAAPGAILADVGAGSDAPLTVRIARHVGPAGRVYATEIDAGNALADLRRTIDKAGLKNVVVVAGDVSGTNLPRGCCGGIYMRNVYHHFDDPQAMNASLYAALRPGGRLVLLDFQRAGREAASPRDRDADGQHGVEADTMVKELVDAGFERVSSEPLEEDAYLVVVRKPAASP